MSAALRLPRHLEQAIWEHALRQLPGECVGVLGASVPDAGVSSAGMPGAGVLDAAGPDLVALYPLVNIAADPERRYLADPVGLLRALRAMEQAGLTLGAVYHSHPHGPARPSATDLRLAEYPVPYLIADVQARVLRAYLLPQNLEVAVEVV